MRRFLAAAVLSILSTATPATELGGPAPTPARGWDVDDLAATGMAARLHRARAERRVVGSIARKADSRLGALLASPAVVPGSRLLPRAVARDGTVPITLAVSAVTPAHLGDLERLGAQVRHADPAVALVEVDAPITALGTLAKLSFVRRLSLTERGRLRTGSVTSEGDAAARADLVRGLGYDGSGVVVGVISDGIDSLAAAQASGNLGAVTVPADPRCGAGTGDEGTALLEIVADVAPGAQLLFAEGISSPLAFTDAVRCLTAAGARVIVDDLGFYGEPYFEDGPIAQAARAATQAGVSFHSAAGNDAQRHVEQTFRASAGNPFHDFLGGPVDNTLDVVVPAFGEVVCVLQWNDPFAGSANDYDLYLLDAALNIVDQSLTPQDGTEPPLEAVGAMNPSPSAQVAKIAIEKYRASDRLLELFCLDVAAQQYVTPTGSVFGHAAVPEVVAVSALDVADPGLDTPEPFASRGPALVFFPTSAQRAKPDLVGFDGVSISNAGGFPQCPPFCRFFGTSAAAPHSAAVAALLLGKNPFLTPAQIRAALTTSAVDIDVPGRDDTAGYGRLDAVAAIAAVPTPECLQDRHCDDGNVCTVDRCDHGRCVRTNVTCTDDGNPCTSDTCDPLLGCRHVARPDGADCGDADPCNGDETCRAGSCVAGAPPDCADADPCTADACTAAGCTHAVIGGPAGAVCQLDKLDALLAAAPAADVTAAARLKLHRLLMRAHGQGASALAAEQTGPPRRLTGLLRTVRKTIVRITHVVTRDQRTAAVSSALAGTLADGLGTAKGFVDAALRGPR